MTYIAVKNLTVSYDDSSILEDVNFSCEKGEFIAIIGKSGTGKTSLLNSIASFIPYQGEIRVHGRISYIFQKNSLFSWMTVNENIAFALDDMPKEERELVVRALLQKIEMLDFGNRYPSQLSGGQIQRVALARSLANNSDIILADEPYGALDYHTRDKMHEWLLHILYSSSTKTVLFVTHFIEEAILLSDRILIIKNKKISNDIRVPFSRPRSKNIKFSKKFIDFEQNILKSMEES